MSDAEQLANVIDYWLPEVERGITDLAATTLQARSVFTELRLVLEAKP